MFVRDKDSAPAALHLAELASELKSMNKTLFDRLNDLYRRYGLFVEHTRSVYYQGKSGQETMKGIMESLRTNPPKIIGARSVDHLIDRATQCRQITRWVYHRLNRSASGKRVAILF